MGVTVWEGTRGFVVSGITAHHQNAGQRFFSKNDLRDFGRAGVTEEKEADLVRGEEPDIAILGVGSPVGFIGVLDRRLPIGFDPLWDNGGKQMSQAMEALHEASWIDSQLFADLSQRNPVQIVHEGRGRYPLVAKEMFR